MRFVTVTNKTRHTMVADRVRVADTSLTRLFGLLGKRSLKPGGGLWIKPSSGVHTLGMMFAIDVVGLDKDQTVVRLWPHLVPFRLTAVCARVNSVIELTSGTLRRCNVQIGDSFQIG